MDKVDDLGYSFDALAVGGSPGGLKDVYKYLEMVRRKMRQVGVEVDQVAVLPGMHGLDFHGGRQPVQPSFMQQISPLMQARPASGPITVIFQIQGEFTKQTYDRIRPFLREDLKNVIIETTSQGSTTEKILLKNVGP